MELYIVRPYGCCSGVINAINLAKKVRQETDGAVYILGMLVHNEQVIKELDSLGIITLNNSRMTQKEMIESLSSGTIIFTAHGHNPELENIAKNRGLTVYDATCHYVKINHQLIIDGLKNGRQIIFIGQNHHPECDGCLSLGDDVILYDIKDGIDYTKIKDTTPYIITQTTLSILELERIYKDIKNHCPNAILQHEVCSSTRIRQNKILEAPIDCDVFFIIGSSLSSNTHKLYDIAKSHFNNADVYLIQEYQDIEKINLMKYKKAAIAAGASTPTKLVEDIIRYLKSLK